MSIQQPRRAWFAHVVITAVFVGGAFGCSDPAPPAPVGRGYVVGFNEAARRAAIDVMERGGSAADAFIAATLVEYVIAPGVTSLAGPLAALTYDAETGNVAYLDATLAAVAAPEGQYSPTSPTKGAAVLVPGALRGLEELWTRYGRLPWAELVEPARALAADGFAIDDLYAQSIIWRREILSLTDYGRETFFESGVPLAAGSVLRQPALAALLERVQAEQAAAMYEGTWAQSFVDAVNAHGGAAAVGDLASYEAAWRTPHHVTHHGFELYGSSGRSYGGPYVLLGLEALEHAPFDLATVSEVDRLEVTIRLARALYEEAWMYSTELDDATFIASRLADAYAATVWQKVEGRLSTSPAFSGGSHSFHVTVVDPYGNAVTGTNTINSLPWGDGLFVEGVPLNNAGFMYQLVPGPGERVINAMTQHLAIKDGALHFIGGCFGSSLLELQLQLVAGLLDERRSAAELHERPRFGTFPFDVEHPELGGDVTSNWIETSLPSATVQALEDRGLALVQEPRADLGFAAFLVREGDEWSAAAPGAPYLPGDVSVTSAP